MAARRTTLLPVEVAITATSPRQGTSVALADIAPLRIVGGARLARLARVAVRAAEALGSTGKGHRWLAGANRALDGRRPLDMLATEDGAGQVTDVLARIEHGVMA